MHSTELSQYQAEALSRAVGPMLRYLGRLRTRMEKAPFPSNDPLYLLQYDGKCRHLHGHNGRAVITLASADLDALGMVMDFTLLKRVVGGPLRHGDDGT